MASRSDSRLRRTCGRCSYGHPTLWRAHGYSGHGPWPPAPPSTRPFGARGWLPRCRSCRLARSAGAVRFGAVGAERFESCQRGVMVGRAIGTTVRAEGAHEAGAWRRLLDRDHASLVLHQQSTIPSLKHLHLHTGRIAERYFLVAESRALM